jgi:hypothetical protein
MGPLTQRNNFKENISDDPETAQKWAETFNKLSSRLDKIKEDDASKEEMYENFVFSLKKTDEDNEILEKEKTDIKLPDDVNQSKKSFDLERVLNPDIKDIKDNLSMIKNEGFEVLSHFTLPKSSWIDAYYSPIEKRIRELKKKYHDNTIALQVFEECGKEIKIFNKYSDYFSYEFFIMQKK